MILRVYKEDWFKNAGIVGFVNIVGKDNLTIKDDYIEFDNSVLDNFQDLYFKYFMDKYDVFKKTNEITTTILNSIDKNEKPRRDKLDTVKRILSNQVTKVKNIDMDLYVELNLLVSSITKSKDYRELEDKISEVLMSLKKKKINEKLTSNKLRVILQQNFFGQVSFFNVSKSKAEYGLQELKDILKKDYVFDINYYCKIIDLFNKSYDELDLDKFINFLKLEASYSDESSLDENLKKAYIKIESYRKFKNFLKNILSFIKKNNASLEEVKSYLETLDKCELCDDIPGIIGETFSESIFGTLGISPKNARNFYWNQNISKEICPLCKLILFCIPAGVTEVKKDFIDDKDTARYLFLNEEGSVEDIIKANNSLNIKTNSNNIPTNFLIDSLSLLKSESEWKLRNKFFIEFISSVGREKKNKVNYFNIPTHISKVFADEKSINLLNSIKNDSFKYEIIDNLLNNRNINFVILKKLYANITNKDNYISIIDCFTTLKISAKIIEKREGINLKDRLEMMNEAGFHIREALIQQGKENEINALGYRLLNITRSRDRRRLGENLLRVIMSTNIPLTKSFKENFLDLLNNDKQTEFEPLCLAFICGLVATPYKKGEVN